MNSLIVDNFKSIPIKWNSCYRIWNECKKFISQIAFTRGNLDAVSTSSEICSLEQSRCSDACNRIFQIYWMKKRSVSQKSKIKKKIVA